MRKTLFFYPSPPPLFYVASLREAFASSSCCLAVLRHLFTVPCPAFLFKYSLNERG